MHTGLSFGFSLGVSGTNLYAGSDSGLYSSTNNGTSWTLVSSGLAGVGMSILGVSDTNLFVETQTGIYRSADNGTSWTVANTGLAGDVSQVDSFVASGSNLFVAIRNSGVYHSTNNGIIWTSMNSSLASSAYTLVATGTNLFAGCSEGVYRFSDNSTSWTAANNGLTSHVLTIDAVAVKGTNLFAGTRGGGIYRSTDNGTSWVPTSTGLAGNTGSAVNASSINNLLASGTDLFAATDNGIYRSTDDGTSWIAENTGLAEMLYKLTLLSSAARISLPGPLAGSIVQWTTV